MQSLPIDQIIEDDSYQVIKSLPNESVNLIVADVPYGINFQSARRIESERFDLIEGDNSIDGKWLQESYYVLKPNSSLYLFTRWDVYPQWFLELQKYNFEVKNLIVWDKVIHGLGDLDGGYAPQYELIVFCNTKGRETYSTGRQTS